MKPYILLVIAVCAMQPAMSEAQTPRTDGATAAPPVSTASSDQQPWIKAQAILDATEADVRSGGVRTIESHAPDLEQALADGAVAFAPAAPGTGPIYVLTDGSAQTLVALAGAAGAGSKRQTIAVRNPYPTISLYLGSYYNEIGKSEDALRVLDAGMKLTAVPEFNLGEQLPYLFSERGAALQALKRWPDALTDYDEGLTLGGLKDEDRARLDRGRGFSLTQLGRLDEAEEAYNTSLKLAPDNPIALNELKYIANLRAGGPATPTGLTLPNASKPQ